MTFSIAMRPVFRALLAGDNLAYAPRRHPWPCAEDLLTSNKIKRLQMLGTSPSMTEMWGKPFVNKLATGLPVTFDR